jgi:hypothetical protein
LLLPSGERERALLQAILDLFPEASAAAPAASISRPKMPAVRTTIFRISSSV